MSSTEQLSKQLGITKEELDGKLSKSNTKAGRLQRECLKVLLEHRDDGALPTSGRFVFYELEGRGIVPKSYGAGKKRTPAQDVSDALLHLREQELVPWRWITDETRNLSTWAYADSVHEYVVGRLSLVRIDRWAGKPPPLILCESRSLAGVLRSIAGRYLCPIAATNGQSAGFLHTDLAPLVERTNGSRSLRVFYLGDLDFSGNQIEENTYKVLTRYGNLEWERLAITERQAREKHLTAIKKPDKRFKPVRYFDAIETEALRQTEIQRILTERLDDELPEPLSEVRKREEAQRVQVRKRLS